MTMKLSRGDDSRTAGAPADSFPGYEDAVRERYDILIAAGEVPELAMAKARADVDAMMAHQADWLKSRADYSTLAGEHRRGQRAAAQGVNPDDLPADEFGNVSPRTVRDANLPIDEQQAQLDQYQDLTDAEIRALREGRFHGTEASERRYDQEQGFGTGRSKTGKTDLDYFREQQQHQGSIRTGRGEMIPMGPAPTPENIQSRREFDELANKDPGSEFQAKYDPASYEEYREGVRDGYRNDARQSVHDFGTGVTDDDTRFQLGLPALGVDQQRNRARRAESEDRVDNSDWQQRRRQERLAARAGLSPDAAAMQIDSANEARNAGMRPEDRFEESLRMRGNLGRQADRQARKDLVAQRGELRGAGLSPAVGDFRNRTDDLIDRLGQGNMNDWQRTALLGNAVAGTEIANPSPLGVEAVGAQNAQRMVERAGMGQGGGPANAAMDRAAVADAESKMDLADRQRLERDRNEGVLPANSPAGLATLDEIGTARAQGGWGFGWSSPEDGRLAVDDAVAAGIPEADAIAYYSRKGFPVGPPASQAPLPPTSTARPPAAPGGAGGGVGPNPWSNPAPWSGGR
jgi:hypothetical protein